MLWEPGTQHWPPGPISYNTYYAQRQGLVGFICIIMLKDSGVFPKNVVCVTISKLVKCYGIPKSSLCVFKCIQCVIYTIKLRSDTEPVRFLVCTIFYRRVNQLFDKRIPEQVLNISPSPMPLVSRPYLLCQRLRFHPEIFLHL